MKRQGEYKRYRAFKDLPNRMLLWHGSRNTNYAGILSQGLRIAPPEAPVVSFLILRKIALVKFKEPPDNVTSSIKYDPLILLLAVI